jgi:glycosyltransferase involved in cell wall biosynthesis
MKNNKKIAFFFSYGTSLNNWRKAGLIPRYVDYFKQLKRCFNEIYLFHYGNEPDNEMLKHVIVINKPRFILTIIYFFCMPIIRYKFIKKADVLYVHQVSGALPAVFSKRIFRKPLVVRCGYDWLEFVKKRGSSRLRIALTRALENMAFDAADRIISTSDELIRKLGGKNEKKFIYIPNYVDDELFMPEFSKREDNSVIFVGRLDPQKNLDDLFELTDSKSEIIVNIVGGGSYRKTVFDKSSENKNIRYYGRIENNILPDYLNKSWIFAFPSKYEGNPKSLLEAMSCGLVVVAYDVEGIRELIDDGVTGFLVNNRAEFISKVKLLLENKKKMKVVGLNARKIILERFSKEKLLIKEINTLMDVLTDGKRKENPGN